MQMSPPDINTSIHVKYVHVNAFIDLLALVHVLINERNIVRAPGQSASMNMEWKSI